MEITSNMRRISSRSTFFNKRIFPIIWFGGMAFFFAIMSMGVARGQQHAVSLLMPVFMAVFGYLLMKNLVFDLVDKVWDAGDELIIKNGGQEEHIRLTDIMNVSHSSFTNPPRVTLSLRRECLFGRNVTFTPIIGFSSFSFSFKNPIVDELIARIDAKRSQKPH